MPKHKNPVHLSQNLVLTYQLYTLAGFTTSQVRHVLADLVCPSSTPSESQTKPKLSSSLYLEYEKQLFKIGKINMYQKSKCTNWTNTIFQVCL